MKVLLCLISIVAACKAYVHDGPPGVNGIVIGAQPPAQNVQIFKIQNLGSHPGGYAAGYQYGANTHYDHPDQIIKVVHENVGGAVQSLSHNPSHQYSLASILPEILKIVFEDSGGGGGLGGSSHTHDVINNFGSNGRANLVKGGGNSAYFKSGQVIEKGHLEIKKVEQPSGGRQGGDIKDNGGPHGNARPGGGGGFLSGKW